MSEDLELESQASAANAELAASPPQTPPRVRLSSIDALRGLTIAGMILVNNPGSWDDVYAPLRHAEWDGLTPTDLIFPTFLFLMGVSIPLGLGSRKARGTSMPLIVAKILWRGIVIVALGLMLNGFPDYVLEKLRYPGVLQRIGICYLLGSLLFITTGARIQTALFVILLVGYSLIMQFVPVPGFERGDLSRAGNVAAYVDRMLLSGHIYKADYDPEGILSTLPALATTLLGMWAGRRLSSGLRGSQEVGGLIFVGIISLMMGYSWDFLIPINKALWSASFVLVTGGYALITLGILHRMIDLNGRKLYATPLIIFGVNPIAAYVLSGLTARIMGMKLLERGGELVAFKPYVYATYFKPNFTPIDASLAWAVSYVMFWFILMAILYRLKIVIRV